MAVRELLSPFDTVVTEGMLEKAFYVLVERDDNEDGKKEICINAISLLREKLGKKNISERNAKKIQRFLLSKVPEIEKGQITLEESRAFSSSIRKEMEEFCKEAERAEIASWIAAENIILD